MVTWAGDVNFSLAAILFSKATHAVSRSSKSVVFTVVARAARRVIVETVRYGIVLPSVTCGFTISVVIETKTTVEADAVVVR